MWLPSWRYFQLPVAEEGRFSLGCHRVMKHAHDQKFGHALGFGGVTFQCCQALPYTHKTKREPQKKNYENEA